MDGFMGSFLYDLATVFPDLAIYFANVQRALLNYEQMS
jgi:hypothetical protein